MPSISPQWMYAEYIKFCTVTSGPELSAATFLLITLAKTWFGSVVSICPQFLLKLFWKTKNNSEDRNEKCQLKK